VDDELQKMYCIILDFFREGFEASCIVDVWRQAPQGVLDLAPCPDFGMTVRRPFGCSETESTLAIRPSIHISFSANSLHGSSFCDLVAHLFEKLFRQLHTGESRVVNAPIVDDT
jgi:hypothetical protein